MPEPLPGKYQAALHGAPSVVDKSDEDPNKRGLAVWLPCIVTEEGSQKGATIVAIVTVIDKNEAIQIATWKKLQAIFGQQYFEPSEMFAEGVDHSSARFEIDVQDDTYQGKTSRKVKWVNVIGEGGLPKSSNPKAVAAKYGAKFRALAGGSPVKPSAPSVPVSAPPTAPQPPVSLCSLPEAWNSLVAARPGADKDTLGRVWFAKIAELFPGVAQDALTQEQCGKLRDALAGDASLPY